MGSQNEVFVARQPILNKERNVIAYELLFRDDGSGEARVRDRAGDRPRLRPARRA